MGLTDDKIVPFCRDLLDRQSRKAQLLKETVLRQKEKADESR